MSQFQPPSQSGWGQPEQQWPQQPSMYMPTPPSGSPPYLQPGSYQQQQQVFPPQYPKPLPPPFWQQPMRPERANIKTLSIVCFIAGVVVYFAGGITALSTGGLLN